MSARIDFMIYMNNVKRSFEDRNRRLRKINDNYRAQIENIENFTNELQEITKIKSDKREENAKIIKEQIEELKKMGKNEDVAHFENELEVVMTTEDHIELNRTVSQLIDRYYEILDQEEAALEEASDRELQQQYVVEKLIEMGQEVYIDDDGVIYSQRGDRNIIATIGEDGKLKLDIPASGKKCILHLNKFEELTKNDLKRTGYTFHTREDEVKLEKGKAKAKKKPALNQFQKNIYNEELLSKKK